MKCPYCTYEDARGPLHQHLAERHSEMVATGQAEGGRLFYRVQCPYCEFRWEQRIKPRWKDPGFLEDYRREIVLVAFDQLLYHVEGAHG